MLFRPGIDGFARRYIECLTGIDYRSGIISS